MGIESALRTVAPWIATALGGPLGRLAVDAVSSALNLSDKTEEGVLLALNTATPEQLIAVKKADQDFAIKLQELGFKNIVELEKMAASDRKDARRLQEVMHSNIPALLSILVTLGYFSILIGMMIGAFKLSDSQAMTLMLGSLGTGWGMVMAFWFGTTANSNFKTDLLAKSPAIK